jgi:hypothetical protein
MVGMIEGKESLTVTSDISYTEDTRVLFRDNDLGWGGGS